MRALLLRHGKLIALVAGFFFSALGALWALLVTDRLDSRIEYLSDSRSVIARQVELLNRTAGEYFIANQQGDLIFIMANQSGADKDLASSIYQGNVLDRATPVRNMIGELAMQKQLDFRQTYDAYMALNEETRKNFTFGNFMRLKQMEAEVIMKGQQRVPELLDMSAEIDRELAATKSKQSRNHVLGVLTAIIGSAVLLAANVISEKAGVRAEDAAIPPG